MQKKCVDNVHQTLCIDHTPLFLTTSITLDWVTSNIYKLLRLSEFNNLEEKRLRKELFIVLGTLVAVS